jgi:trehalose 6-phosphate synthase/phosphatase
LASPLSYQYVIHRAGAVLSGGESDQIRHLFTQSLEQGEPYQVTDDLWHPSAPIVEHVRSIMSLEKPGEVSRLHHRATKSTSDAASFMSLRGAGSSSSGLKAAANSKSQHKSFPNQQQQPPQTVHLNSTDGLVVVSVFLPVILQQHGNTWNADWDYEALLSMQTHLRVTRIGVVKHPVRKSDRRAVEELLSRMQCVPVWVDPPETFAEMYNGFCKGVLWPVLHNVTSVYSHRPDDNSQTARNIMANTDGTQFSEYSMEDVEYGPIHGGRGREADLWRAYNNVNRLFAEGVVQCFHEGDLVWIHGFHLLILPSYLARRLPMAKVGIFLHTPFPSSEIFRTLWCREDLLRGMLNADQVGFHLFEYARHFLTSCRRLLGCNYGMVPDATGGHTLAIDTNGRNVIVTSIHAGVEPSILNQILTHTVDTVHSIRNRVGGRHICCGVDRLESLKGIPLKLLGLERFLLRCPEYVGKIVLVQVGISAHERGDDYIQTQKEVTRLVEKINGQWPGTVEFQECNESEMKLQQRMAILRAADTVVVTAIRDGLNLLPLEFTIAHQDALTELGQKDMRKRGLCILSEFSSCTRVMRGALHVNPWRISELANAFLKAISMNEDERLRRISIASEFVTRVTTQRWALAVMLDLKGVQKSMVTSGVGLGLNYHLLGMDTGFNSLDTTEVMKAYRKSSARLILIDYGGTIVSNDNVSRS